MTPWLRGVATLVARTKGGKVVVRCPFCDRTHTHDRQSLGSREVLAGCHVGWRRCRSYAIPRT